MWRSSLWSISWLLHQMFCPYVIISRPIKVTTYATRCRHFLSLSFSGIQRNLGYVRPALWCNWPSNAPLKDLNPKLRHSNRLDIHREDRPAAARHTDRPEDTQSMCEWFFVLLWLLSCAVQRTLNTELTEHQQLRTRSRKWYQIN